MHSEVKTGTFKKHTIDLRFFLIFGLIGVLLICHERIWAQEECGSRGSQRRPIFFCEEFNVFVSVPASDLARAAPMKPTNRQRTNEHTGLCMDCANAETCTWPKPEGGVWHCEEYC